MQAGRIIRKEEGGKMKYEEARKKPRVFQQLTGLKIEEFDKLKAAFQKAYEEDENERGTPDSRAGRKAVLLTYEDKLFFILFYLRHYPTQEVLGFLFGISQGQANQWIHRLTPIVQKALGVEKELPGRTAADAQELMEACPERAFILDGTERPVRRPQDSEDRRKDYSGKKKRHTKKNIILTEKATGEVLGLGATQPGSKHDKASVDEEHYTFPDGSTVFQGKGFQGYAPEGATIQQPTKKPRGKEWTPDGLPFLGASKEGPEACYPLLDLADGVQDHVRGSVHVQDQPGPQAVRPLQPVRALQDHPGFVVQPPRRTPGPPARRGWSA